MWGFYLEHNHDKILSFTDIIAPLFRQDLFRLKKLSKLITNPKIANPKLVNTGLLILMSTWLLNCVLLSETFSQKIMVGLFKSRAYPMVETIEDLVNNENILVFTGNGFEQNSLIWFNKTKPAIYIKLRDKFMKDTQYFKDMEFVLGNGLSQESWIKGVSDGELIYFQYEGFTQNMRHTYAGRYPNLYLSENKYCYNPQALVVGRKHIYSKKILAL